MAFEGLSDKLEAAFKKLRGKGKLTETDVRNAMREVRLALLEADVNYKVARDFTAKVTERAIGAQVMESLTPGQMVVKIVNEELTELMGGTRSRLASAPHPPTVVMMCGLQGVGKTTYCAKLGLMLKTQGNRPLLVACDIYRPAAIKQLQVVGEKAGVPVFEKGTADPVEIAREAIKLAKDQGYDYVLLDTAGRLHIDEELMDELKRVKAEIKPHEILLLIDAMTGQDAVNVATAFNEALGVDGLVLTKLDGDTRGGAALSARAVTGKPIKFIGTGEKLGDLDAFHPDRMADRILGMGDIMSLVEQAQDKMDIEASTKSANRMMSGQFTLTDMLVQFQQLEKMGSLGGMMKLIPGMNQLAGQIDEAKAGNKMKKSTAIIQSMTMEERENPNILRASRKNRIAKGSGTTVADVNRLLNEYEKMKQVMKQMGAMTKSGKMPNMGGMGAMGAMKNMRSMNKMMRQGGKRGKR